MLHIIKTVHFHPGDGGYGTYLVHCNVCGQTSTDEIHLANVRRSLGDCPACIELTKLKKQLLTTAYATNEIILRWEHANQ